MPRTAAGTRPRPGARSRPRTRPRTPTRPRRRPGPRAPGPAAPSDSLACGPLLIAERLLTSVRDEIARADTKASILLSGAVAVLTVAATGAHGPAFRQPWAAAAAAVWCAGIVLLVIGVLPRTRPAGGPASVTAVQAAPDPARLTTDVREAGLDPTAWLLRQICDLGVVLRAKYRCLRGATACLAAAALLAAAGWR
jgi:pycsar effector protein